MNYGIEFHTVLGVRAFIDGVENSFGDSFIYHGTCSLTAEERMFKQRYLEVVDSQSKKNAIDEIIERITSSTASPGWKKLGTHDWYIASHILCYRMTPIEATGTLLTIPRVLIADSTKPSISGLVYTVDMLRDELLGDDVFTGHVLFKPREATAFSANNGSLDITDSAFFATNFVEEEGVFYADISIKDNESGRTLLEIPGVKEGKFRGLSCGAVKMASEGSNKVDSCYIYMVDLLVGQPEE